MYKFYIKTGVLYPKMYIWTRKKIVLFTLNMKFLPNNFTKMYKFLDKNWSLVPKNVHFGPKNGKICTFYSNNEVPAKKFHQNVKILDKNCSFVPNNVYLVPKKRKNCTFYTKNEVFAKKN